MSPPSSSSGLRVSRTSDLSSVRSAIWPASTASRFTGRPPPPPCAQDSSSHIRCSDEKHSDETSPVARTFASTPVIVGGFWPERRLRLFPLRHRRSSLLQFGTKLLDGRGEHRRRFRRLDRPAESRGLE